MPIDMDEFEDASEDALREGRQTVRRKLLEFLAYNPEKAYSREEIQSSIGIDAIDLLHELSSLEVEGHVRHKGRYWTIAADYDGDVGPDGDD